MAAAHPLGAAISVSVSPSQPLRAPVGTTITWYTEVTGAASERLWYRFRVREAGSAYRMVRDYGLVKTLDWTASDHEGTYEIEVSVRDRATGETAVTSATYQMTSRISGSQPLINATSHPLVFLYSAPPCEQGSRMRVRFQSPDGMVQNTPYKPCRTGVSMNFYLAGLLPDAQYTAKHIVEGASGSGSVDGPEMGFVTGSAPPDLVTASVVQPLMKPVGQGVVLHSTLSSSPLATDLNGNLLWFCPGDQPLLTRPAAGGYFFGLLEGGEPEQQLVREFDLVGMTVRETNAARINEQLAAMGRRPISGFHHEAGRLSDGKIYVLAAVEQILTDVQGPGPVDVIGDMIIVLDPDLQVVWSWDAFDHLDISRQAVLGETCSATTGGCPSFFLAPVANDWTHGNSVQQTPDGNLVYSSRHQDWVMKIEYQNGQGGGYVIWRLGKDGDFQNNSTDPYPWFSHQHDVGFEFRDNGTLVVFDNGNTRRTLDPNANSRGQVIQLDETNRVATLLMNADLGVYSVAVGSAQKLRDGDYHFDAGFVRDADTASGWAGISIQVDPDGNIVYQLKSPTQVYRSFRMTDLYTPR